MKADRKQGIQKSEDRSLKRRLLPCDSPSRWLFNIVVQNWERRVGSYQGIGFSRAAGTQKTRALALGRDWAGPKGQQAFAPYGTAKADALIRTSPASHSLFNPAPSVAVLASGFLTSGARWFPGVSPCPDVFF